ncbi:MULTISPECIES: L-lactate permease [Staphylococcus]|uniref:L-lactate permease n=3 Tax=Staphylococcus TaxID=1279 RepID=A0AAP7IF03_9STAP|nr:MULTISPECIES: L-lactate permease [Staphylococcus]KKI62632.1 L-lactate permease [Staphylococcus cohnii subsp. cohnii]MDK9842955.1 L-lactate permease [Staphylococcus equorum]MDK9846627.1 L-lactate permease [Staphylococcus equorum]MDK9848038.1 L-lactate permease [Staphylococcus equorum]MDK9854675.1 L-lactate permease [Staphylococcus equorum]
MLVESFNPFNNLLLSSIVAAIPIILFLLCLTVFKMKGVYAAITTLIVTIIVAMAFFKLPGSIAGGATLEGFYQGIIPIGFIVIMAVWLYKIATKSGQFAIVQDSIASVSRDQRVQLLLIGFVFNGFLEGAAGFGVPIAICAVLLTQLGFKPLQAAMYCLVGNAAAGAYGAVGIPIAIVDTLNLPGGVTTSQVALIGNLTLGFISFVVPFLLMYIMDGFKGVKETFPATLVVAVTFTVLQVLIAAFAGPELADIIPGLVAMIALALFSRKWQPKNIFRINKDEKADAVPKHSIGHITYAWSPFIILTIVVMIWSLPAFKGLFEKGGALSALVVNFNVPGTMNAVTNKPNELTFNFFAQTGTAILITAIITIIIAKNMSFKTAGHLLGLTVKELWISVLTICFILAVSKITTYGGLSNAMGQGISKTGTAFPLLSPLLGWIGVFMTGSVVNNNSLFAPIQASVAEQIGTKGSLLVAANVAGGVTAKIVSPQSIAIATAAVNKVGKESELMKMAMRFSIGLLILVCIWTFICSLFIS